MTKSDKSYVQGNAYKKLISKLEQVIQDHINSGSLIVPAVDGKGNKLATPRASLQKAYFCGNGYHIEQKGKSKKCVPNDKNTKTVVDSDNDEPQKDQYVESEAVPEEEEEEVAANDEEDKPKEKDVTKKKKKTNMFMKWFIRFWNLKKVTSELSKNNAPPIFFNGEVMYKDFMKSPIWRKRESGINVTTILEPGNEDAHTEMMEEYYNKIMQILQSKKKKSKKIQQLIKNLPENHKYKYFYDDEGNENEPMEGSSDDDEGDVEDDYEYALQTDSD